MSPYREVGAVVSDAVMPWIHGCPSTLKHDEPITGGYRCRICGAVRSKAKPRAWGRSGPHPLLVLAAYIVFYGALPYAIHALYLRATSRLSPTETSRLIDAVSSIEASRVSLGNVSGSRSVYPRSSQGGEAIWVNVAPSPQNYSALITPADLVFAKGGKEIARFDGGAGNPCLYGCMYMTSDEMRERPTDYEVSLKRGLTCSRTCESTGASKQRWPK